MFLRFIDYIRLALPRRFEEVLFLVSGVDSRGAKESKEACKSDISPQMFSNGWIVAWYARIVLWVCTLCSAFICPHVHFAVSDVLFSMSLFSQSLFRTRSFLQRVSDCEIWLRYHQGWTQALQLSGYGHASILFSLGRSCGIDRPAHQLHVLSA